MNIHANAAMAQTRLSPWDHALIERAIADLEECGFKLDNVPRLRGRDDICGPVWDTAATLRSILIHLRA
jgi:hypothetical protein